MSSFNYCILLGIILCFLAVFAHGEPEVKYVDVTEEVGINFEHFNGVTGEKFFLEALGSGAAFFDYDNDGDLDLYLVNGAPLIDPKPPIPPTNALYRNNGDGTFTDVTKRAGVGDTGYGLGCAVGDYDNDGFLDLYVANFQDNVLYRNNGDSTFTDVTKEAGVSGSYWSSSCSFFDYDNDGYLDLYVANFANFGLEDNPWCGLKSKNIRAYCEPDMFEGTPDVLYHNNGDGTFTDVTKEAGINSISKGLGLAIGDYDNDGYLDIYVASDATINFLHHNNGDGTFVEIALPAGVGFSEDGMPENGMGTNCGDYDNDGYLDITVTNYENQTNTLYHNDGDNFFSDLTFASGTGEHTLPGLCWGTNFFDFDNDGYKDIFYASGHVIDNLKELGMEGTHEMMNFLFWNRGDGTFSNVSSNSGSGMLLKKVSRGAAFGDYDNDGDIDILVTNCNQAPNLLRNDGGNRNNWLVVKVIGTESNRAGIGTRIRVVTGTLSQIEGIKSGSGYLSQNDLRAHFGLGRYDRVDLVEITWPSGLREQRENIPSNRLLIVTEGQEWRLTSLNSKPGL